MAHWYDNPGVYLELQKFHDRHAYQPNLDRLRRTHIHITNQIRSRLLQERMCKRIEYAGSAHHGVQIGSGVEFDVLLVMDGGGLTVVTSPYPDSFYLKAYKRFIWGIDKKYKDFMDDKEENMIVPSMVGDAFYDALQRILFSFHLDYKVKLVRLGPVVQFVVMDNGQKLYAANFIPCFEENESWVSDRKRQFIAKPIKGGRYHFAKENLVWRQCFAAEENDFFHAMEKNITDDCRKKILRLLKAIRCKQPSLTYLSSYHFKAALFSVSTREHVPRHFRENYIIARLMDVLRYIEECFLKGHMEHPILGSDVNLIDHLADDVINGICVTIRRMRTCEKYFREMITIKGSANELKSWNIGDVTMARYQQKHDTSACLYCQKAAQLPSQSSCVIQ